jgi:hypothetical protein
VADLAAAMTGGNAVTFMVAAGLVFEIVAAACSSPQTAEINAQQRSGTLMKWVKIGLGMAALFVLIAAVQLKGGLPAIYGGGLAGSLMWLMYVHANRSGLRNGGPSTESQ